MSSERYASNLTSFGVTEAPGSDTLLCASSFVFSQGMGLARRTHYPDPPKHL